MDKVGHFYANAPSRKIWYWNASMEWSNQKSSNWYMLLVLGLLLTIVEVFDGFSEEALRQEI
jgi:hypothetical protein